MPSASGIFVAAFVARGERRRGAIVDDQLRLQWSDPLLHRPPPRGDHLAAGDYIRNQFDARGTVNIDFDTEPGNGGPLAFAGSFYQLQPGTFRNGLVFQRATTNTIPHLTRPTAQGAPRGTPSFSNWYYRQLTSVPGGQFDMQSVALHELSHTLGFSSLITVNAPDGSGPGISRRVSGWRHEHLQSRSTSSCGPGTAANDPLLVNPNGTFNSSQLGSVDREQHLLSRRDGNGGQRRPARSGWPAAATCRTCTVPSPTQSCFRPSVWATARRTYQNVELAMLIDIGLESVHLEEHHRELGATMSPRRAPRSG